jgi:two-component system, NtrC family, sensor kinase
MRESPNGRKPGASPLPGTDIDGTRRQPSLGTILVVDDDRDTADMTAALLQSMGLAVMAAYSAGDGLDRLDESPDICLVVSDVRMPGVDGFDFIRVVRHRFPSLPALLTTGLPITDEDVIPRGVLILQKPYAIDELRGAIAEQLQIPLDERPASL